MHIQIRPSRDLRNKYSEISKLAKEHKPVIITNNGKGYTVLISIEDYAGYEDYLYDRDQHIAAELVRRKETYRDPNVKWYDHGEFWNLAESDADV